MATPFKAANLSLFGDNRRFLGQFGHSRESCRTGEFCFGGGSRIAKNYWIILIIDISLGQSES